MIIAPESSLLKAVREICLVGGQVTFGEVELFGSRQLLMVGRCKNFQVARLGGHEVDYARALEDLVAKAT